MVMADPSDLGHGKKGFDLRTRPSARASACVAGLTLEYLINLPIKYKGPFVEEYRVCGSREGERSHEVQPP